MIARYVENDATYGGCAEDFWHGEGVQGIGLIEFFGVVRVLRKPKMCTDQYPATDRTTKGA